MKAKAAAPAGEVKAAVIQYRPLATLKKHPQNPRTIKDASFKKLVQSIRENPDYFEARPIILSDRTGELIIIAGNQRYEAARDIGIKDVPTALLPGLSEEREREIMIRDNIANGDWDWDLLANDWNAEQLAEWGLDVPNWDAESSFGDKNKELDLDSFEDIMELKLKFSKDEFLAVSQALDDIAEAQGLDSKEEALQYLLSQEASDA